MGNESSSEEHVGVESFATGGAAGTASEHRRGSTSSATSGAGSGGGAAESIVLSAKEAELATHLRCFVDDEFVAPRVVTGESLVDCNTGATLQPMMDADQDTVERAIAAAHKVHRMGTWRQLTVRRRCEHLKRVAEKISTVEEEMAVADAVNTGVVIDLTKIISSTLKGAFDDIADGIAKAEVSTTFKGVHGDIEVSRKAWGPTVVLSPWNVPGGSVVPKIAAALAAGAPVILKPSEWAPNGLDVLMRAAALAKLPKGVFQMVHGGPAVGKQLVADPRIRCVNFTGSTNSGRMVAGVCAQQFKRCLMELGGNNAMVVLGNCAGVEDVIADRIVQALTVLNGQWCAGLGRLLVHRDVLPRLLECVMSKLAKIKLGSSAESGSEMGPISNPAHLANLRRTINKLVALGGKVHSSTPMPEGASTAKGNFLPPTLITGVPVEHCRDELFGPVCTVHAFDMNPEAVDAVNLCPGMLQCYLFSTDEPTGLRLAEQIECGLVMVNGVGFCFEAEAAEPTFSYWGTAGVGDDGPLETIVKSFCGNRVTGINGVLPAPPPRAAKTPSRRYREASRRRHGGAVMTPDPTRKDADVPRSNSRRPRDRGGASKHTGGGDRMPVVEPAPVAANHHTSPLDYRRRYYHKLDIDSHSSGASTPSASVSSERRSTFGSSPSGSPAPGFSSPPRPTDDAEAAAAPSPKDRAVAVAAAAAEASEAVLVERVEGAAVAGASGSAAAPADVVVETADSLAADAAASE